MRRSRARFVAAWAMLVECTLVGRVRADDAPVAQALFDQAKKAMAAHDYAEACPKLEESYRLQEALGTRLNLAVCYEAEGRLASAWTTFLEVATKARAAGQMERSHVARDRAAALVPRLSNLAIDVPNEARVPGLEIRRDGTPVGPAEWGSPLPADPGDHTVEASAPDRVHWSKTVTVAEGAATVRVAVPVLEATPPEATASPAATQARPSDGQPAPAPAERATSSAGNAMQIAGWVTLGVGAAGLAAGGAFGLLAMSAWNSSMQECGTTCTQQAHPTAVSDHDKAVTFGAVSTTGFIAGGVLMALGFTLVLTAPRGHRDRAAWILVPSVGPAAADLALKGEF